MTRELWGRDESSTNNRMELVAAIRGLEALKVPCVVEVWTDSKYVQQAFTLGWLENWKRNGWVNAKRKPVENQDLWRELDALASQHDVRWHWVRGHNDHPGNTRADALANRGVGMPSPPRAA